MWPWSIGVSICPFPSWLKGTEQRTVPQLRGLRQDQCHECLCHLYGCRRSEKTSLKSRHDGHEADIDTVPQKWVWPAWDEPFTLWDEHTLSLIFACTHGGHTWTSPPCSVSHGTWSSLIQLGWQASELQSSVCLHPCLLALGLQMSRL